MPITLPIKEWDGEPVVRLPDEVLQPLDLQIGDTLHLAQAWGGGKPRLVLSKTQRPHSRVYVLVAQWERELADEQAACSG